MTDSGNVTESEQTELLAKAKSNINKYVHPAYQLLIDYFTTLQSKATNDDGFWRLPNGEAAYVASLKFYTTTDYTPQYIHDVGLKEVNRIQSEIMTILAAQNYDVTQGFTEAIESLAAQESFYYEDSDAGRAQILADYQTILDEIDAGLDSAFRIRPKAGMEVVRIPEFKEKLLQVPITNNLLLMVVGQAAFCQLIRH